MEYYKKPLYLIIFFIFILGLSSFVLLFTKQDRIKNNLNGELSFYAHFQKNTFAKMSEQHQTALTDLLNHLMQSTVFSKNDLIIFNQHESAILKYLNESWKFASLNNEDLINFLNEKNISYHQNNGVVIFPIFQTNTPSQQKLTKNNLPHNLRFKFYQGYLFFSGQEKLIIPPIFSDYLPEQPLTAYLNYKNNTFQIKTTLKSEKVGAWQDAQLSSDNQLYFNNIVPNTIAINASPIENNLNYLLLQKINSPVEFSGNEQKSDIIIYNKTISEIQDIVRYTLATIYPSEKNKYLYDGSLATHLVVDPTTWEFKWLDNQESLLEHEKYNISIKPLSQETSKIQLTITYLDKQNLQNLRTYESSCIESAPQIIKYRPNTNSINQVIIHRNKLGKINICID